MPPPGWYPDPVDARAQRWWDGTAWTEHVAYPQTAMVGAPAGPAPTATAPAVPTPSKGVVAPPEGRWGLWDIGWTALAVLAMFVVGFVLVAVLAIANPDLVIGNDLAYGDPAVAWALVISQTLVMAALAGWPMIAARWKGDGWRRSFGFVVNGRAWWVGAVGGIGTFLTLVILTAIASVIVGESIDSAAADVVSQMSNVTLAYAFFLMLIAIGAPFVEEMAFRGLMWGAIVKRGWSPWLATSISAVFFGLFHFEPLRVVPLIAAGFVLGVVRHYGGLGAAMFSHAIVNTIGVGVLLLAG